MRHIGHGTTNGYVAEESLGEAIPKGELRKIRCCVVLCCR